MTRSDLLALTPDALAALANRGLVKRAAKDLDAGAAPELALAEDGALTAVFPDGARAVLAAEGGLETATCTCGASGKCRHRIGAVLAYQREHEGAPAEDDAAAPAETAPQPVATPAAITDDQLREALGHHALKAAEATRRAGYTARLVWPGPDRPAVAELPAATVSFLVPGLGYVHTDATGPARAAAIVLAVWAFREAPAEGTTTVSVGGTSAESSLAGALALAEQVLLDGVDGADAVLRAALQREAKALTRRRAHWPAGAVNDLIDQLQRYEDRSAAYDPHRLAALLAELPARARASAHPGGTPPAQILGSEEADATPLTLVRLTGIGARIGTDGDRRTLEVYFAQPETGMVLAIQREWPLPEDGNLTGAELAGRKIAGCRISALAGGNTVTEAATRTAARALKLGTGRLAKTQVLPLGLAWNDLPNSLRATDLDALAAELADLPPGLVRPRVAAESLRVIAIASVDALGYDPATQCLEARITAPGGGSARLRVQHRAAAPGALEAAEKALATEPLAVAGHVRRHRGELIVEPTAILTGDGPVVPDLAPGDDSADLAAADHAATTDPVAAAIEAATVVCADLAHQGLRRSREPSRVRVETVAANLKRVGLQRAANDFVQLSKALGDEDEAVKRAAWTAAAIRIQTTAELH
ncbi:SWIM zinc finger family protein [Glycomyces sp. NRRL B-16210]|uniref:SWIM zinc finger family protein n=1 Tax=Glycomyces sp. NRRL B-16210 TaxID=1463821 RepID=UPI0004C02E0E|nr:SWIM zinc finger family protein [Glycomyces sp. NRRL B-16210]